MALRRGSRTAFANTRQPSAWWWFLVPLLSCGLATSAVVILGGIRSRTRSNIAAGVGYLIATMALLISGMPLWLKVSLTILLWIAGTFHALTLQLIVAHAEANSVRAHPAVAEARRRSLLRDDAREILTGAPAMAAELFIGRPDIPGRTFDDGGLIDVNHVSAEWLAYGLGLSAGTAAQVVAERRRLGGFTSPEELLVYCGEITPDQLAAIRDRLIFVRH